MKRSARWTRRWSLDLVGVAATFLALLACSSGEKPPVVPVACLASSAAGQAAYRRLEGRWADLPPERRRELEGDLRAFIVRFGSEDVARLERLRLALVVME